MEAIFNKIDSSLFYFINNGMQNPLFDSIMPFITHYENWYAAIAIFTGIILFKNYRKAIVVIVLTILALIFSDAVNHNILKQFFGRVRPCNNLPNVHLLAGCSSSFSFPSSHTSNIFAISSVLAYEYRKIAALMILIAVAVAYSRVYLGVHYPADVIVGGMFGSLYGVAIIKLKQVYLFKGILKYES